MEIQIIILILSFSIMLIIGIITISCLIHFIGFPKCVGKNKYSYKKEEVHVEYDDINIYGKMLIPNGIKKNTLLLSILMGQNLIIGRIIQLLNH